jgi:hypothetical protein
MITTAAGPQGVFHAGTTVDVPEGLARAWVASHCAVSLETPMNSRAETAMLAPAEPIHMPVETRVDMATAQGGPDPENPGDLVPGFGKYHNGEYKEKPLTLAQIKAQDPEYLEYLANKQEKDPAIAAAAKAVLAGA